MKTTKFWSNNVQIMLFCYVENVFHKKNAHL